MKATLSSLLPALLLFLAPASQVSAIVWTNNDSFASALNYSGASSFSSNTTATVEPGEPSHRPGTDLVPFRSVWWKFTPTLSGYYQIDTAGSNFDTVLALYTGTTVNRLTRVANHDDVSQQDRTSLITRFLTKGVIYRIAVGSISDALTGSVSLHVSLKRYCTVRTYQGLLGGGVDDAGMYSFSVASSGAVTGKLRLGAGTYPFTAAVNYDGEFSASMLRPGLQPASLSVTLPLTAFSLNGMPASCNGGLATVSYKIGQSAGSNQGGPLAASDPALVPYFPASAAYTTRNPCPRAGRYPFTTTGSADTGYSVATVVVGVTGICTGSGRLGDGTPFAFSAPIVDSTGQGFYGIGTDGAMVFHVPLYAGKGRFTFIGRFDATKTPVALGGNGTWSRPAPATSGTVFLPLGVSVSSTMYGSRYVAPVGLKRLDAAFDANSGALIFSATSLTYSTVIQGAVLSTANTITYPSTNPNLVKLAVNKATAMVAGSVKFTGAPAATAVSAVLIHHPTFGTKFVGYAVGTTGYGKVTLAP